MFTEGRTFDETMHLLIHCDLYVRLDDTNRHWGKLSLGPLGLARIYGQAHACPNVATREKQLLIAKTIDGLHADGSPHIDNYLFRGFTDRTRRDRGNFYFESQVPRTFFRSGHADDPSQGTHDTRIGFTRYGNWHLDAAPQGSRRGRHPLRARPVPGLGLHPGRDASSARAWTRCSPRATACCPPCTTRSRAT